MTTNNIPTHPCPDCRKKYPDQPSMWRARHVTNRGTRAGYCKEDLYTRQKRSRSSLSLEEQAARASYGESFGESGVEKCVACHTPSKGTAHAGRYVPFCTSCTELIDLALPIGQVGMYRFMMALERLGYWGYEPNEEEEDLWARRDRGELLPLGPPESILTHKSVNDRWPDDPEPDPLTDKPAFLAWYRRHQDELLGD
jgi:hypothetical protein